MGYILSKFQLLSINPRLSLGMFQAFGGRAATATQGQVITKFAVLMLAQTFSAYFTDERKVLII